MTGEAVVFSLSSGNAVVEITRSSACGHDCAYCGACNMPKYKITVQNPLDAKVGDRVLIETDTASVLKLSFVLYILPVFLLIIAALVCDFYSLGFFSVVVFLILSSVWFALIKFVNKRFKPQNTICKILD